jgi:hypothetical protein
MAARRLNGHTCWAWADGSTVAHVIGAIVTDDRISFDVRTEDCEYTVLLRPAPSREAWWTGEWRCKTDNRRGHAEAKVRAQDDGCVDLVGVWSEDADLDWTTELVPA